MGELATTWGDDETPLRAYPNATYLVATSSSRTGPFRVAREKASVAWSGAGDLTLFADSADPNRMAYVAYDAWSNGHRISIERLTDDYADSVGSSSSSGAVSSSGNEAPIVFLRNSVWYLLYGPTCCFCHEGSGSVVLTAPHPLGPWNASRADLNPKRGVVGSRPIAAQESFIVRVIKSDSFMLRRRPVVDRTRIASSRTFSSPPPPLPGTRTHTHTPPPLPPLPPGPPRTTNCEVAHALARRAWGFRARCTCNKRVVMLCLRVCMSHGVLALVQTNTGGRAVFG